jgi:hypothetical protein
MLMSQLFVPIAPKGVDPDPSPGPYNDGAGCEDLFEVEEDEAPGPPQLGPFTGIFVPEYADPFDLGKK